MNHYSMKSTLRKLAILSCALTSLSTLSAAVFTITSSTTDTDMYDNESQTFIGQPTLRAGYNTTNGFGSVFYIFSMPSITSGEVVTEASLSFSLTQVQTFGADLANADLFALDYRNTTTITLGDHYHGAFAGDVTHTGIQDDIMTRTTPTGTISTDSTGSGNVLSYINTQIGAGATVGDYLIFRLNVDDTIAMTSSRYYTLATADNSTSELRPVLSFTTEAAAVPEPSTYTLLTGLASLTLIMVRRHSKKTA